MEKKFLRVLLVEDDSEIQQIFKVILERKYHCQVIATTDGTCAIELAHQLQPDFIIMDLMLPGLNGLEAATMIHSTRATFHIPILLVSDHCWDIEVTHRAMEIGCYACLEKRDFLEQIDHYIQEFSCPADSHSDAQPNTHQA